MHTKKFFKPKSFVVIGAGPSGCILAAFLARAGHNVILCDIVSELIEPALDRGIILDGDGLEKVKQPVSQLCNKIEDLKDLEVDVIFVATKATALFVVAEKLSKIHKEGVYIVSWQNGIDTERELSKYINEKWILRAVVNYGCSLLAPAHAYISFHHYPHYLQGITSLSKDAAKNLAETMTNCGLMTDYTRDIKSMVWKKAILNAAMNPVCAVTGLTMYQAMREKHVFKIVDSLLKECILVAKYSGIDIEKNYYDVAINYMSNAGKHKPSMLMDIESSRTTEIDYINGKFVKYGLLAGIKTPYNSILEALVKGRELEFRKTNI